MRRLVQAENPDFIAFTGDMVSGRLLKRFLPKRLLLEQIPGMVRRYVESLDKSDL